MKTLYDILGALPDDDAERLRSAFRKAVKAHHPDNNPDDPDAPHRFRRIVRAHNILADQRQRATYDWLLAVANQQQGLNSKRGMFSPQVRSLLPNVIGGAAISLVSISAFLLFGYVSRVDIVPARVQGMSARASALAAAMPAPPSDTVGRAARRDEGDEIAVANKMAAIEAVKEVPAPADAAKEEVAPGPVAAADNTDTIPASPEVTVKDASYYRQQGSLAYRSGDLSLALIDFDQAINLDPSSSDAYVDRAIVFHRMGDLKHAFADIAEAKRIDDLGRRQAAVSRPQQAPPSP
jgi:curved DNA-binding protein CbpA